MRSIVGIGIILLGFGIAALLWWVPYTASAPTTLNGPVIFGPGPTTVVTCHAVDTVASEGEHEPNRTANQEQALDLCNAGAWPRFIGGSILGIGGVFAGVAAVLWRRRLPPSPLKAGPQPG